MGRRGPSPDHAKREAFAKLIAEGVPSARACRMVGIHPRTGKRWRNGRRITSGGRVLNLAPVITLTTVPEKRYSPRYLSEDERVRLADLRREERTMREIAVLMGRSPATISRELARGADAAGRYRPFEAHRRALGRRRLHRPSRLARDADLRDWVTGRLKARWSPEQIARGLRRRYPDQPARWLCAETIYQAVYRPDLGGLPRELPGRVLRLRRRHRLPRRHAQARRSGPLIGITSTLATTEVYFCDPHSPWQRPSNENANGLLRAYFPKGTDLSVHTVADIALVQAELNRRPRKILGWDSPADRLATLLGSPSVLRP